MACGWYRDPKVYEYMSSDTFWLLGIAIAVNGWWTNRQVERFIESKKESDASQKEPKESKESSKSENETKVVQNTSNETKVVHNTSNETSSSSESSPTNTSSDGSSSMLLQPHITSQFRKFLALIACGLVFPLQLLEGSWVLITTWRLTVATLKATYPRIRPRILGFILYLPVTAIIASAWAVVLGTGAFLICMQIVYFINLKELEPGTHARLNPDEKREKRKSSDGEWDQVEEVVQGAEKDQDIKRDEKKSE